MQTKSDAVNVFNTVPADSINKVISQKDDFSKRGTNESAGQTQQQQQGTSESASSRARKLSARKVEREQEEDLGNPTEHPEIPRIRTRFVQNESTVEKSLHLKSTLKLKELLTM